MKRRAQPWLGTLVEITIADPLGNAELLSCFNHAFAAVADVHRLMSFHDPASDVSRINAAAIGEWVGIHAHTHEVIRCALAMAAASGGVFDVTCAPKLVEWGYLPAPAGALPEHVPGRPALILQGGYRIAKTNSAWIDLGGIAKGYAVDLAIETLRQSGIRSACVNAGGDLRAYGGIAYAVAIRHPEYPHEAAVQTSVCDDALATSGTYFSRRRVKGRACSALVDGSNGRPIIAGFSASVRAPTCMLADTLTKIVMASADPKHPALARFGASAMVV
jgi:thiamine biosynthesis lipoprotein